MNNFQSYKIKDNTLYLYFVTDTEFASFNNKKQTLKDFVKKIGFSGNKVKLILAGTTIATISFATIMNSKKVEKENITSAEIIEDNVEEIKITDPIVEVLEKVYDIKKEDIEEEIKIPVLKETDIIINKMLLPKNSDKVSKLISIDYLVIHNTDNSATALNEVKYLNSVYNTSKTSFHYAVDESEIWQAVDDDTAAHHAGDYYYNQRSLSIEIARSISGNLDIRDNATENGAMLAAKLLNDNNLTIDNMIMHKDVTGKQCPRDIIERYGWENFKDLVKSYI